MNQLGFRKVIEFILLALLVFGFRLMIEELMPLFEENLNLTFGRFLIKLLSNYPLTLVMLLMDIMAVYLLNRYIKNENSVFKVISVIISALIISLVSSLWMRGGTWIRGAELTWFADLYFTLTLFTGFVFNLIIVSMIQVYSFYTSSQKKALNIEIGKKNKARFQYQQLKSQLNPHFLFNSLNVLDYLIHTDSEKASDFVRKLSSVYRYLLNKGDNTIVPLKDELEFVNQYVDLLKERFDKGLIVNCNIEEAYCMYSIIPGGLQLLVENAIKHNVISIESPLKIDIFVKEMMVVVKNNLQPRINTIESSGIGIKNIRGQYRILLNRDISVSKGDDTFEVRLPLI